MILIVGNNKDDILYFETRLNNKKEEIIFNKYRLVIGEISNQGVILLSDVYTNVLSSAVVGYIIEKYYVFLVFKIGKCSTLSDKFKTKDLVISKKIIAADIDVCDIQGIELGQIPNFNISYNCNTDIINLISQSFLKVTHEHITPVTFVSSNKHYTNIEQLGNIVHEDQVLQESIDETILDSESYGMALICSLYDIEFIAVNVILNKVGDKFSTSKYVQVLKEYANVGKSIVNAIGEIGSNEVLRG